MLVAGGRNVAPNDLEHTAQTAFPTLLRPGCLAAFAIPPPSLMDPLNPAVDSESTTMEHRNNTLGILASVEEQVGTSSTPWYIPRVSSWYHLFNSLSITLSNHLAQIYTNRAQ